MSCRLLLRNPFLACACMLAASHAQAQKPAIGSPDSTFENGIDVLSGRALTIDLATGGALVIRGWDRDSVRLLAHLAGRDWRDSKVHLDRTPAGIRLRSSLGGSAREKSTSHHFEVWVPISFDLELQSLGGDVSIVNVNGQFRGQTRGGSIALERVRGFVELSTRGGAIEILDFDLDGRVTTRGGPIKVERVTGGVRAAVSNASPADKVKPPR
jgi:hypothetical protein